MSNSRKTRENGFIEFSWFVIIVKYSLFAHGIFIVLKIAKLEKNPRNLCHVVSELNSQQGGGGGEKEALTFVRMAKQDIYLKPYVILTPLIATQFVSLIQFILAIYH